MIGQVLEKIDLPIGFEKLSTANFSQLERQFAKALERLVIPVLQWSKSSLGYYSAKGELVNIFGEGCHCNILVGKNANNNEHTERSVFYHREFLGTVILCCPRYLKSSENFISKLVENALLDLTRQEEEEGLLTELGTSWESLQAVYDLHADLNSFHNLNNLLQRITKRVNTIGEETKAVFWLYESDNLIPIATNYIFNLIERSIDTSFIGSIFKKQQSFICNEITDRKNFGDEENELKNAFRLAVFPVATRINNYGVLAVWQEKDINVFDSHTINFLNTLTMQAAMIIETDYLHSESIKNEKLQQELEIGSTIQKILLTEKPPESICGIKISALTIPSQKIDGDFYDFIEYNDDCVDLIVGDVMGKGIPAALIGAATKNCFLRSVVQLQSLEKKLCPAPEKIVSWVNSEMTNKLIRSESFVTVCYARIDLIKKCLTFVDCGHTKTIHYNQRKQQTSVLEGDNMPLGFSDREIFSEQRIKIENGDFLFFFSDGITEAKNSKGEIFGDKRLSDFITKNAWQEPKILISNLLNTLEKFADAKVFQDDLTCVAIRIEENFEPDSEGKCCLELESNLSELGRAREFVRNTAKQLINNNKPLDPTFIEQFELAVTEALTNIIFHAFNNQSGNQIELVAEVISEGLQICLKHQGISFDPTQAAAPVFDGSREGGFGLFIISNCVDCVTYSHDSGKNSVCMIKKLCN